MPRTTNETHLWTKMEGKARRQSVPLHSPPSPSPHHLSQPSPLRCKRNRQSPHRPSLHSPLDACSHDRGGFWTRFVERTRRKEAAEWREPRRLNWRRFLRLRSLPRGRASIPGLRRPQLPPRGGSRKLTGSSKLPATPIFSPPSPLPLLLFHAPLPLRKGLDQPSLPRTAKPGPGVPPLLLNTALD